MSSKNNMKYINRINTLEMQNKKLINMLLLERENRRIFETKFNNNEKEKNLLKFLLNNVKKDLKKMI